MGGGGGRGWRLNNHMVNESSCLRLETQIKTLDTKAQQRVPVGECRDVLRQIYPGCEGPEQGNSLVTIFPYLTRLSPYSAAPDL